MFRPARVGSWRASPPTRTGTCRPRSRRACGAEDVWRRGLREAGVGEPKPSQLLDVEASLLDGAHRVGRGVTATGEPGPERGVGDLLHRAQASGVGNGVLEEPEDPTRP